jgi:hypothetical protein
MSAATGKEMPHLFAGIIALGLAAIIFFAAERVLIPVETPPLFPRRPKDLFSKTRDWRSNVPPRIR